eukprot:744768-Amphidinium_carterae.1
MTVAGRCPLVWRQKFFTSSMLASTLATLSATDRSSLRSSSNPALSCKRWVLGTESKSVVLSGPFGDLDLALGDEDAVI